MDTLIDAENGMKFCGCGRPEEVQQYLRDVLTVIGEDGWDTDRVAAVVNNRELAGTLVLHMLEAMGLTGHEDSVYSSWLTAKGEALLKRMQPSFADLLLACPDLGEIDRDSTPPRDLAL